jgi:hypothetical protein
MARYGNHRGHVRCSIRLRRRKPVGDHGRSPIAFFSVAPDFEGLKHKPFGFAPFFVWRSSRRRECLTPSKSGATDSGSDEWRDMETAEVMHAVRFACGAANLLAIARGLPSLHRASHRDLPASTPSPSGARFLRAADIGPRAGLTRPNPDATDSGSDEWRDVETFQGPIRVPCSTRRRQVESLKTFLAPTHPEYRHAQGRVTRRAGAKRRSGPLPA